MSRARILPAGPSLVEVLNEIPIWCETEGCPNHGDIVNVVLDVAGEDLDSFYESYDGSEPADFCRACGKLGIAGDPVPA
ncbi:MAG TPA: hypothetical protein VFI25_03045 [Planctomycetota bacterium]|nr:hypothetical protein [Planctomycetota bacterium]